LALTNLILARGDTFLYFYPYWSAAASSLRRFELPLWNPDLFLGAPFLANSQVGVLYPLNWPLWWLLPTPYAVSASILLHLLIAALGTYLAARRALHLGRTAAWLAAALFALGGYLTAQVEHVNQLQGLAWLPWLLAAAGEAGTGVSLNRRRIAALALLLCIQLLAGHTQTVFISAAGLALWLASGVVGRPGHDDALPLARRLARAWLPLLLAALLAAMLAAAQLGPTLELASLSNRQGGLPANEVVSFSLHPLHLGRALLPTYGSALFSEYVAFLPLTALLLTVIGGWRWRGEPAIRPLVMMAATGLFLALGRFNVVYWGLASIPGFNLFRAPARWLALYALAAALLAGYGWQLVAGEGGPLASTRDRRPLFVGVLLLVGLIIIAALAGPLAERIPAGPEAPLAGPALTTWLGWLLEGSAALALLAARLPPRLARARPYALAALGLVVHFAASRSLPYNNLTTPEAYFDLRPAPARLMAETAGATPPARVLSLSDTFFDPGDKAELDSTYADQLEPAALYDYIVAIKQKEIIAPNLGLLYGLPSVDGFDGGILPLAHYTALTSLFLPGGEAAADGRLREYLDAVPADRWLDLLNAGYVITDKIGDAWRDEVYYDRQFPAALSGDAVAVARPTDYEATGLRIIGGGAPGTVSVTLADGATWQLEGAARGPDTWQFDLPEPARPVTITLRAAADGATWNADGLTLIDERDGSFQSVPLGNYRLIHSGDVKVYERPGNRPRAYLVHQWLWRENETALLGALADPAFDSGESVLLSGVEPDESHAPGGGDSARITLYTDRAVHIVTTSASPSALVLGDTYYPGWRATVDGELTRIYRANSLFRAVLLPAGEHQVAFVYEPASWRIGLVVSAIGGLLWLVMALGRQHDKH
jgi:hypothetical protein